MEFCVEANFWGNHERPHQNGLRWDLFLEILDSTPLKKGIVQKHDLEPDNVRF